ncbi:hypothetical protein ACTXT7_009186 [Hymenolepis weldensis]
MKIRAKKHRVKVVRGAAILPWSTNLPQRTGGNQLRIWPDPAHGHIDLFPIGPPCVKAFNQLSNWPSASNDWLGSSNPSRLKITRTKEKLMISEITGAGEFGD